MISRARWLTLALVLTAGMFVPKAANADEANCACCPPQEIANCCCEVPRQAAAKPALPAPAKGLIPSPGAGGSSCRCQVGTPPASPTTPATPGTPSPSRLAADPHALPGAPGDPLLGLPRDSRLPGTTVAAEGDHPSVRLLRQTSRLRF